MTGRNERRRLLSLAWPALAFAALGASLLSGDGRRLVLDALSRVSPVAVLATLPAQAIACLLCGWALFAVGPGPSLRACILARSLRDAGANLLVFLPGMGEIISARALVLAGGRTISAVSASAIDNVVEAIAQIPFALLAVSMLPRSLPHVRDTIPVLIDGAWLGLAAIGIILIAARSGPGRALRNRLAGTVRAAFARATKDIAHQRRGVPMALLLHLLAWAVGGIGLWMAARALSLPLGLGPAIVVESIVYAVRGIVFFVPAGLAVQEWAFVVAGGIYGLSTAQSLALALVLRFRDLAFGLALFAWPFIEARHAVRAGELEEQLRRV